MIIGTGIKFININRIKYMNYNKLIKLSNIILNNNEKNIFYKIKKDKIHDFLCDKLIIKEAFFLSINSNIKKNLNFKDLEIENYSNKKIKMYFNKEKKMLLEYFEKINIKISLTKDEFLSFVFIILEKI